MSDVDLVAALQAAIQRARAHKASQPTRTPRDGNDWPDDPPEPTGPHIPPWRAGDPLHEYRRFVCVDCHAGFSTPEPLEAHAEYTGHGVRAS